MNENTFLVYPELSNEKFTEIVKKSLMHETKSILSSKFISSMNFLMILKMIIYWELPPNFFIVLFLYSILIITPSILLFVFYKLGVPKKLISNNLSEFQKKLVIRILFNTTVSPFNQKLKSPPTNNFFRISNFIFSMKTQKEVFDPLIAEWQFEYFDDLKNKKFGRAKWTNIRWSYSYLVAMFQKSPIGDLIEFVSKFAK